ncbi:MAG: endonuclease VIII, partial [Patescibacteria group bacterium]
MMEIGEAYSIAKQLKEEITGKKIKKVEVGYSPHKFAFFSEDINIYNEIVNSIVDDIYSVGGYVEMKLDKYRLILGEGVSLRYLDKNQKLPEKHQLCIIFDDDSKIICSVQMYGVMMVFKEDEFDNIYYQAANKFPSPLTEEFSLEYFKEIYTNTKKSLSIKA